MAKGKQEKPAAKKATDAPVREKKAVAPETLKRQDVRSQLIRSIKSMGLEVVTTNAISGGRSLGGDINFAVNAPKDLSAKEINAIRADIKASDAFKARFEALKGLSERDARAARRSLNVDLDAAVTQEVATRMKAHVERYTQLPAMLKQAGFVTADKATYIPDRKQHQEKVTARVNELRSTLTGADRALFFKPDGTRFTHEEVKTQEFSATQVERRRELAKGWRAQAEKEIGRTEVALTTNAQKNGFIPVSLKDDGNLDKAFGKFLTLKDASHLAAYEQGLMKQRFNPTDPNSLKIAGGSDVQLVRPATVDAHQAADKAKLIEQLAKAKANAENAVAKSDAAIKTALANGLIKGSDTIAIEKRAKELVVSGSAQGARR